MLIPAIGQATSSCDVLLHKIILAQKSEFKLHDKLNRALKLAQREYRITGQLPKNFLQITNDYLLEFQNLLTKRGITSLVKISDQSDYLMVDLPVLEITLDRSQMQDPSLRHLALLQKAGEVKKIVLNPNINLLKENRHTGGSYKNSVMMVFVHPKEVIKLIKSDRVSMIFSHEFNHALLYRIGEDKIPSPYNIKFGGEVLPGNVLQSYKRYISAQELHNYATDPFQLIRDDANLPLDPEKPFSIATSLSRRIILGIEISQQMLRLSDMTATILESIRNEGRTELVKFYGYPDSLVIRPPKEMSPFEVTIIMDRNTELNYENFLKDRSTLHFRILLNQELHKISLLHDLSIALSEQMYDLQKDLTLFIKITYDYSLSPTKERYSFMNTHYQSIRKKLRELYTTASKRVTISD